MRKNTYLPFIFGSILVMLASCSSDQGERGQQTVSQTEQIPAVSATASNQNTGMDMSMDNMQGMSGTSGMGESDAMSESDDVTQNQTSDNGFFQLTIEPESTPLPLNQMHGWVLNLQDNSGNPVDNAQITVEGGMPAHNHGMPTVPQVTANLGGGRYQVEGVQFQMPGHWVVTFNIDAGGQSDSVTYNLMLHP